MLQPKKTKIIRQLGSLPPPTLIQMACHCGLIFCTSATLTNHLFDKHMYLPQYERLQSITKELSTISRQNNEGQMQQQYNNQNPIIYRDQERQYNPSLPFRYQQHPKSRTNDKKPTQRQYSNEQINQLNDQLNKSLNPSHPQPSNQPTDRQKKYSQYQLPLATTQPIQPEQLPHKLLHIRQFYNSKIFMCGECLIQYTYNAELNVHISLYHNGVYPDGTIFGLKKLKLFNHFSLPYIRPIYPTPHNRDRKYKCGCGNLYSASSALVLHIQNRHKSVAPLGSIGLPKSKLITNFTMQNEAKP